MLFDPWGNPFELECIPGDKMVFRAAGPDRTMDTSDDIVSES
jgi:hypothetical protein